jgi:hypothetical protein
LAGYHQFIRPTLRFSEERAAIGQLLTKWCDGHAPPGIDNQEWNGIWGLVYNGFGNVCYTHNHVSLEEMSRLKADLLAKMDQPPTIESLRWFWNRLAETGPHGKKYIKQMTPLLDDILNEPQKN